MEVVNFRVGNRIITLNILDILLTEKFTHDQTSVPTEDPAFLGVKSVLGTPTPIFDLGIALNKRSTLEQNENLINLLFAYEKQHDNLLDNIYSAIKTNNTLTFNTNIEQCSYNKWHNRFKGYPDDIIEILTRCEQPHKQLHRCLDKAIQLAQQNKKLVALHLIQAEKNNNLASLKRLFYHAREQLEVSYKPITIFTTLDGQTPTLGFVVDKVENSSHINSSQISQLNNLTVHIGNIDHRVKNMITGLLTTNNQSSLLLSPKAFL